MSDALEATPNPYEALGGNEGIRKLAARFYAVMTEDEYASDIRRMHGADLAPIIERLTGFLTGWLGGPRDYFQRDDAPCIMSVHKRLPIGENERDQWLHCMARALRDCGASEGLCESLEPAFARLADAMRSQ